MYLCKVNENANLSDTEKSGVSDYSIIQNEGLLRVYYKCFAIVQNKRTELQLKIKLYEGEKIHAVQFHRQETRI